ncbi:hypothetical protein [Helicovermis profundi]|uniref:Uncharacterized protein n=1 Tax=Helicovermis profundi TaxID=3065157 RepID=A0AAU9E268_9FIRM|nr:hypothetical protein HLPR_03060 [Clostridia bacterium S502]
MINKLNLDLMKKLENFYTNFNNLKSSFTLSNMENLSTSVNKIVPYIETIYKLNENSNKLLGEQILKELKTIKSKMIVLSMLQKSNLYLDSNFSEYYFIRKSSEALIKYEKYLNLETRYFVNNYNINFLSENIKKSYSNLIISNKEISKKICFSLLKTIKKIQNLINFVEIDYLESLFSMIENIRTLIAYLNLLENLNNDIKTNELIDTIISLEFKYESLLKELMVIKSINLVFYKEKDSTIEFLENNIIKQFKKNKKNILSEIKYLIEIEKTLYLYLEKTKNK